MRENLADDASRGLLQIITLQNGNSRKSSYKILKLDPFLDQDGLLKMGKEVQNLTYQMEFNIQLCC